MPALYAAVFCELQQELKNVREETTMLAEICCRGYCV